MQLPTRPGIKVPISERQREQKIQEFQSKLRNSSKVATGKYSDSGGVNYPAGNTVPFDLDASLLSPKRDKSSHMGDLRDCTKVNHSLLVF
ncbi:hypothetical protein ASPTUDRAFT_37400 [Aspergillus tubingensis CBS 134.48]|uniref:Uncharacterized protein n=1 Tax=Aspergillus tubingensis (strain CBS 134.48) TaxID=767770 RepID=A0A1L9NN86_ASPTC|nr:hypothetical protein ASPTUDRAFT_37400 [Aspergillus tubingensis CBS 134.48]